jgi:hypothetical protein
MLSLFMGYGTARSCEDLGTEPCTPTLPDTAMKPRWIDWLAAAAIAFTLGVSTTTSVADDLQRLAQNR